MRFTVVEVSEGRLVVDGPTQGIGPGDVLSVFPVGDYRPQMVTVPTTISFTFDLSDEALVEPAKGE